MSTSQQVYDNFYYFVCCYIANSLNVNNAVVIQQINNNTISFGLQDLGDGKIFINTWNVPNVVQPQFSDLLKIANSSVSDCKLSEKPIQISKNMPELTNILLDIYNKIGTLPNGKLYDKQSLLAYLKSIM